MFLWQSFSCSQTKAAAAAAASFLPPLPNVSYVMESELGGMVESELKGGDGIDSSSWCVTEGPRGCSPTDYCSCWRRLIRLAAPTSDDADLSRRHVHDQSSSFHAPSLSAENDNDGRSTDLTSPKMVATAHQHHRCPTKRPSKRYHPSFAALSISCYFPCISR